MNTGSLDSPDDNRRPIAGDLFRFALWLVWQCVRLPLFLLLLTLAPVTSLVLGSLALLGVLTAFFWKLAGPSDFHFFLVLGIALGFHCALLTYNALLRLLSQGRTKKGCHVGSA